MAVVARIVAGVLDNRIGALGKISQIEAALQCLVARYL